MHIGKRTASVFSKSYTTVAELTKTDFDRIWMRYPFIYKKMEKRVRKLYNDKWKRFLKRSLKNIDYLSEGISDQIIDEISYMFEIIGVEKGTFLFKKGTPCKDIYIISNGELEIYIDNRRNKSTLLETLDTGCSVGCYR